MPVTIDGTKGVSYPTWTTANRPTSPITGQAGYNTTLAQLELYNGTTWSTISIVLPTLLSVTGDVYSGLATNLTILGTTLGLTPGIFRFTSGGVIADVSVTPVGTNTITLAVPASIRAIAAGNTVSIVFINDLGVSNIIVLPIYGLPNGGTRNTSGAYSYNAITSSTNLIITKQVEMEYLIIAGGGAGGHRHAGGGGAGGVLSGFFTAQPQTYVATVGAGGAKLASPHNQYDILGNSGTNSSLFSLAAIGGGGGGSNGQNGASGGSAGGDGERTNRSTGTSGTTGQGFAGGGMESTNYGGGGGGGGAGGVGINGPASLYSGTGGRGGPGRNTWSAWATITGTGVSGFYAGGGGAGGYNLGGYSAAGGSGGGGNGGGDGRSGADGATNTGSGGGGGGQDTISVAGSGASGIIILKYLTPT
jgi:hypothetical protein